MFRNLLASLPLLFAALAIPGLAHGQFPPTPAVKLAVNPVTDKVYTLDTDANSVTVFDAARGTTATIAVGNRPEFIAVNPATNRVYVDNTTDATLTVIDGASDTVLGTYGIGAEGPISIDPVSDIVYIVRLTGTGSDEVTFFDDANTTWYTIATNSFQPNAMAVDPATHTIYVTHYSTGDVRIISGAFNPNDDFPASTSIGVFSHPFAIAPNVAANKFFVITQDPQGPVSVIDGSDKSIVFPPVASGHAVGPQAIVVNPVTNKAYAAFENEVIVIDGATDALTYVPIQGASSGAIALGIDYSTNRIYAVTALGTLSVIDGDSETVVATQSIASGASNIAVDSLTHTVYYYDGSVLGSFTDTGGSAHAVPLTATIEPMAGNTGPGTGSVTIDASNSFSPTALAVRAVYFRMDSTDGPWSAASGTGPYTASFSGLAPGAHTVFAFAADGEEAPLATGPQSVSLLGSVASYTFTVPDPKVDPSLSLASSANPSPAGQDVTFTASASGANGTPTGTMDFLDGASALCSGVALSSGTAACAASSLAIGSHSITARYSGDASYNAATSSVVVQQVNMATASAMLASSLNPSTTGQAVTFTATVSGASGTPTGTVTFDDGTTALCTAVAL
ncbi:MAG TPA: Ig-like domain repeat protein, partial [Usitatibacter sp.]|nr:Ig-like domain repeat protein [Usitatibacter sp.]